MNNDEINSINHSESNPSETDNENRIETNKNSNDNQEIVISNEIKNSTNEIIKNYNFDNNNKREIEILSENLIKNSIIKSDEKLELDLLLSSSSSSQICQELSQKLQLANRLCMDLKGEKESESIKIRPLSIDERDCEIIEENIERGVYYRRFSSEDDLQPVIDLITKDLSEPYSIYTYRYFIYNWPRLCIMAFTKNGHEERCIGAIVGKTETHAATERTRGYIAMLAVQEEYRRRLIGSRLVELVIDTMIRDGCAEVVLETEITNRRALSLYEKLGFIRDKRLFRYYLNGVDAYRLKLWISRE